MASEEKVDYPSDVSDEEWAFVLPYLLLSRADSAGINFHCRPTEGPREAVYPSRSGYWPPPAPPALKLKIGRYSAIKIVVTTSPIMIRIIGSIKLIAAVRFV